jgi:hypothetical protein
MPVTLAAAMTMVACGEDKDPVQVCQGHDCGAALLDDGGEVQLNTFLTPFGDATASALATFYKNQTPAKTPFIPRNTCVNLQTGMAFPYTGDAPGPVNAVKVVQREYIDVGSKVTLTSEDGTSMTLSKQMDGVDFLGRHQGLFYMENSNLPTPMNPYGTSLPIDVVGGNGYDTKTQIQVSIEGSAAFAAQTYSGGVGSERPGLVIPNRGHFSSGGMPIPLATKDNTQFVCDAMNPMIPPAPICCDPAMRTCTGPAAGPIGRDEWTITWDTSENIWDDEIVSFAFVGGPPDFAYVMQCNVDARDGTFTMTKADLDQLPEMGGLVVARTIHMFNEFEGRRIDMAATSCANMLYAKLPPM